MLSWPLKPSQLITLVRWFATNIESSSYRAVQTGHVSP